MRCAYCTLRFCVERNNQRALRRMNSSVRGMVQCAALIAPYGSAQATTSATEWG
jgi:hypothetical protein